MKFSVIIPLYNKEKYITKTLNSVLSQTYRDFELIIINDGSSDKSIEKVREFKDSRIKIFSQNNKGVAAARNLGVNKSKGNYILFIDADDFWEKYCIAEFNKMIKRFPKAKFLSVGHRILEGGKFLSPAGSLGQSFIGYINKPIMVFANGLSLVNSSCVCVEKQALISVGCFPVGIKNGEDVCVWLELMIKYKFAHSGRFCSTYNRDRNKNLNGDNIKTPYYFSFLDKLLIENSISPDVKDDLKIFFFKSLVVFLSVSKLNKNYSAIEDIKLLNFYSESFIKKFVFNMLLLMPEWLLNVSKQIRRKF